MEAKRVQHVQQFGPSSNGAHDRETRQQNVPHGQREFEAEGLASGVHVEFAEEDERQVGGCHVERARPILLHPAGRLSVIEFIFKLKRKRIVWRVGRHFGRHQRQRACRDLGRQLQKRWRCAVDRTRHGDGEELAIESNC